MLENGRGFNEKWAWLQKIPRALLQQNPPLRKSSIHHWGHSINFEQEKEGWLDKMQV